MVLSRVRDVPIAVKTAIAPAVVLVLLLVSTTAGLLVIGQLRSAMDAVRDSHDVSREVTVASAALAETHALLYRLTAQGTNTTNVIDGTATDLMALMDAVIRRTAEHRAAVARASARLDPAPAGAAAPGGSGGDSADGPDGAAPDADLDALLARYETVAGRVADLASLGSAQAMREIVEADALYDRLRPLVDALDARAEAQVAAVDARVRDDAAAFRAGFVAVVAAALVIGAAVAWAIGRGTARRVVRLAGAIERLARGDTSIALSETDRRDELGGIERAARVFRDALVRKTDLEARARKAEAEREDRLARRERLLAGFGDTVTDVVARLARSVEEVHTASTAMRDNTARTVDRSAGGAQAASDSAEAAAAVQQSLSTLGAAVEALSGRVARTAEISGEAEGRAATVEAGVADLSDLAERIGRVVGLIADIADRTNLLALNATIEAARAGEHGRGFAIVAAEVKDLASQTARATEEIDGHIRAVQDGVRTTVDSIGAIAGSVRDIKAAAGEAVGEIDRQNAAKAAIVDRVATSADHARATAEALGALSGLAEDTGRRAEAVYSVAGGLRRDHETLEQEVSRFLQALRAMEARPVAADDRSAAAAA